MNSEVRLKTLAVLFSLSFVMVIVRLIYLQFYSYDQLIEYRENRRSYIEQIAPKRGTIYDARGRVIAEDKIVHNIYLSALRREKIKNKNVFKSNLEPLSVEQILALTQSQGGNREFEERLAVKALADASQLVIELARLLKMHPQDLAEIIVTKIIPQKIATFEDLLVPKLLAENLDFTLAMKIRIEGGNSYKQSPLENIVVKAMGKRVYPMGKLFAHITGTIGELTAEDYKLLRGEWIDNELIPGTGVIKNNGRIFFSVKSDMEEEKTDEEQIIKLRELKRNGQIIKTSGHLQNSLVGRGGLEQYYNQYLRGRHVLQRFKLKKEESSAKRMLTPEGINKKPENGCDINLTIDARVQENVTKILEKHLMRIKNKPELVAKNWNPVGTAILMDPNNGRIKALVSYPAYDPNTYKEDFDKLLVDPANPLLDRTISGIYPPGSVVKPLVGLAAMTDGKVAPGETFYCDKVLMLGGARFTCLGRHGDVSIVPALRMSCNIYFYHAGENIGSKNLYNWYTRLGLGHNTGIDLAGETGGIVPRAAYTRKGWALGNTYHISIGQGLAITPLQIAVAYSALANANRQSMKIVRPHLVANNPDLPRKKIEKQLEDEVKSLDLPIAEISVDYEALSHVRQGMWEVIQGELETGARGSGALAAFKAPGGGFLMEWAGKSGTAEWSKNINGKPIKQVDHVWFAGYAPFDKPEVVVVVMVPEAGGGGGGTCAPIAKEIMQMWFNLPSEEELQQQDQYYGDEGEILG